jgi:hypothetical protein
MVVKHGIPTRVLSDYSLVFLGQLQNYEYENRHRVTTVFINSHFPLTVRESMLMDAEKDRMWSSVSYRVTPIRRSRLSD